MGSANLDESFQALEDCLKMCFSVNQVRQLDLHSQRSKNTNLVPEFNKSLLQLEAFFLRCRMLSTVAG